ncbi:MAG: DEAD/DEAH box helicase family protein [Gammaproteobacteria bacterium]
MTLLRDLPLKSAYHKPVDDIAGEFYLPCLARSKAYARAVGYFSSAIYVLAWSSLRAFVEGGGRIRLICSPVVSPTDVQAMAEGYAARDDALQGTLLKNEFERMLSTAGQVKPARVLATFIAMGIVDIRIAWVGEKVGGQVKRLFHDKVGIFTDAVNDAVAFKGSMNETWPGLALDGNLESVDVFASWGGAREANRVSDEQAYFEKLWTNVFPGVITVPLPQVALDAFVSASDPEHWPELVDDIVLEIETASKWSPEPQSQRTPRPHQLAALEAWEDRGRQGIFKHATGSGKTFTALCAIGDAFRRNEVVLVVVPSDLLLRQWARELHSTFDKLGLRLLVCGGGHSDWRQEGRLPAWTRYKPPGAPRAVLTTVQTGSTPEFLAACQGGAHLFIVADEVHRLGAQQAQGIFSIASGPRLGLSATPERAGDPEGTNRIFNYFNGIVPPPFTLFDAINARALTQYAYHVHRIELDPAEQANWEKISREIRKQVAQLQSAQSIDFSANDRLKLMLIRRARIVKGARQKVGKAVEIVLGEYKQGQHWIVYCDDQVQLSEVRDALRAAGCANVFEYHTAMTGDQHRTLGLFEQQGGVVVSIRCLDEGVDIPAVSHALILASSKNPREYIQRRGRVLRKSSGKTVSHIHDVLVTPRFDAEEPPETAILEGELARAIEFGSHALNPGCITDLQRLAIEHAIRWDSLIDSGLEDDQEEQE